MLDVQTLPVVLLRSIRNAASRVRDSTQTQIDSSGLLKRTQRCPHSLDFYGNWRILIAEDNKINRVVLSRLLKKLGFEDIDVATNGRIAVEMEQQKAYDVVLMDWQMPEMDGLEACQQIVERREGDHDKPKVIFVTAHASADYETACRKAGGSDFIPKPVNLRVLESLFQRLRRSSSSAVPASSLAA